MVRSASAKAGANGLPGKAPDCLAVRFALISLRLEGICKPTMMRVTFFDRFLIWLAVKLRVSPLMAHILLMVAVTALFAGLAPDAAVLLRRMDYLAIWFLTCAFGVVVTWLSKGEYKDAWRRADVWRE